MRPGEKARIEATLFGPIENPQVNIGGISHVYHVTLGQGEKFKCGVDAFPAVSGAVDVQVSGSDPGKASARIELVKRYEY